MDNILFTSERLLFRCFTADDVALVHQLNSDPAVLVFLHEEVASLEKAAHTLLNSLLPQYEQYGYGRWAVHLKDSGEFIGWCGLKFRPERNETDLGYRFLPQYWGMGYATEAASTCLQRGFDHHGLTRITAAAHKDHPVSQKILKKIDMNKSGTGIIDGVPVVFFEIINHF